MTSPRTAKRSRSGAQAACPQCGKLLRGAKGMKAHVRQVHESSSSPSSGDLSAPSLSGKPLTGTPRHPLPASGGEKLNAES
jgi:hypothetical protein